jgi:hypothetical protein
VNGGKVLAPSNTGFVQREVFLNGSWKVKPNGNPIPTTANPTVLCSYKSVTVHSDRKAPTDYVRMISKLVPNGPVKAENDWYYVEWENSTISLSAYPNGCSIPNGDVVVPDWMVDKVVRDAKAEMNQLEANILEDLGQLRQTGDLIASIVKLIYDLYLACRKGNFGPVRKRLRELGSNVPRSVANGWLMYFYGIKPLVSTIDALAASQKPLFKTLSVRKRQQTSTDPLLYIAGSTGHEASGNADMFAQCQISARVKMDGNVRYWAQLGLTGDSFTDAVVTAWALVPYSFVVDWFVPVEGWLRSLSWSPNLVYQGGFIGRRHKAAAQISITNLGNAGGKWGGVMPSAKLQVVFYRRTTYPYFVPPSFLSVRLGLSWTQIISASALLIQQGK